MNHNIGKGRRKAENQWEFREKKKEDDPAWLEKEAKRVKKYYVPISQMTEPEKAARRKKVRGDEEKQGKEEDYGRKREYTKL